MLLLGQEIDLRLLQPMTLHRLAELRKEKPKQSKQRISRNSRKHIMWSKQIAMAQTGWKLKRQLCFGTM